MKNLGLEEPSFDVESISGKVTYSFPLPLTLNFFNRRKLAILIKNARNESLYRVGPFWACESPESHLGASRWAIDFLIPDGIPVVAAADGIIVAMKMDSQEGGPSKEFQDSANYVVIDHGGEFSQYCHLALPEPGILRKRIHAYLGKPIKRGERIGYVGKTGWTTIDHLHFMVFKQDAHENHGFRSLRVTDQWEKKSIDKK